MKKIQRHALTTGQQEISLPRHAEILAVQLQLQIPYLWALVEADEVTREFVTICVYGTNDSIEERDIDYIDTFQVNSIAYHVFRSHDQ